MKRRQFLTNVFGFAVIGSSVSLTTSDVAAASEAIADIPFNQDEIRAKLKDQNFFFAVINDVSLLQRLRIIFKPRGDETSEFMQTADENRIHIIQDLGEQARRSTVIDAYVQKGEFKDFHDALLTKYKRNRDAYQAFLSRAGIDPGGFLGNELTTSAYYYGFLNVLTSGSLQSAFEHTWIWPFC